MIASSRTIAAARTGKSGRTTRCLRTDGKTRARATATKTRSERTGEVRSSDPRSNRRVRSGAEVLIAIPWRGGTRFGGHRGEGAGPGDAIPVPPHSRRLRSTRDHEEAIAGRARHPWRAPTALFTAGRRQKVEHYEISGYLSARTMTEPVGCGRRRAAARRSPAEDILALRQLPRDVGRRVTTAPIPVTASDAVAAMLPSPPYRRPVRRPHVEEVTRTSQFHGVLADDELGQRRCAMIAAIPPANRTEIAKASAPHEAVQVVDEVAHFRFIWSFFGSSRVSAVSHRC